MTSDQPRGRRFVLINPTYTRLWAGQSVSALGDVMFSTTLVLWVATVLAKGQPWAPAAVSAVLLATGVAVLVMGPLAGVFADRWDGRAHHAARRPDPLRDSPARWRSCRSCQRMTCPSGRGSRSSARTSSR